MEGAGAPAAPTSANQGLTTTESGIPIAPVYAGAAVEYDFSPVTRNRKSEFDSQQMYRHPDFGTEFKNPYVPRTMGPRGGIDMVRHMSGTGQIYEDPLDLFKPQNSNIDRKPEGVKRPNKPQNANRQRDRGASAYRKVNKENTDAGVDM